MTASPHCGDSSEVLVVAHRGASNVAPENTKSALAAAIEVKAPVIEFDVRETSDGKLVLFHDDSLERVAGRKGSIETSRWEDLHDLDIGGWFGDGKFAGETPLLLDDALPLCAGNGVIALVERKSGSPEAYASVIREWGTPRTVIVQSFDWDFLTAFQELMPEIPIGALGSKKLSSERISRLEALRPVWVGWKHSDLTSEGMRDLQVRRFRVALWTINDPVQAGTWIERGVDAIITDRPDAMLPLVPDLSGENRLRP